MTIFQGLGTVSFHNFKSQNFKLSVSNPKSKYVAYLSVLAQISNCQGLGRKNKHENLKTDRIVYLGPGRACAKFVVLASFRLAAFAHVSLRAHICVVYCLYVL